MIISIKCQRTNNPLAFFWPYRNQVPIFSGSLLRNGAISHSAGMLKLCERSITNTENFTCFKFVQAVLPKRRVKNENPQRRYENESH